MMAGCFSERRAPPHPTPHARHCCCPAQALDVSNNRLRRLPSALGWLALRQLNVTGNPGLVTPPKPVLAKGLKAVLSFLQVCGRGGLQRWGSPTSKCGGRSPPAYRLLQCALMQACHCTCALLTLNPGCASHIMPPTPRRRLCASSAKWWRRTCPRSASPSQHWRRRAAWTSACRCR